MLRSDPPRSDRPTLARIVRSSANHDARTAIVDGDTVITYGELHNRAQTVADTLFSLGVRTGDRVAIQLQRSIAAVISVHGGLLAGAVVAPIDPADSEDRIRAQVKSGSIDFLITNAKEQMWPVLAELPEGLVLLQISDSGTRPDRRTDAGSYLLFTSGSAGIPKGVLLDGAAVAHFAQWAALQVKLDYSDHVAAQAALTFDLSTFDLFSTAISGCAVVIVPEWLKAFPHDLAQWLRDNRISVIYAVPTLLRSITSVLIEEKISPPGLKTIVYAGEPYPEASLSDLLSIFPDADIYNLYGPTETNVCLFYQFPPGRPIISPVPIGRPIPGVHACLVNESLKPTSTEGELVIAGPPLLRGYTVSGRLNDPTQHILFPDGIFRRAYSTGDRARVDENGRFYLIGRADRQIKRRGHRIDLDGIGFAASRVDGVPQASAILDSQGRIALFVEAPHTPNDESSSCYTTGSAQLLTQVSAALLRTLPLTHQPDTVTAIPHLPLTVRGKIDLVKLKQTADQRGGNTPYGGEA